jgi:hypothetical protein
LNEYKSDQESLKGNNKYTIVYWSSFINEQHGAAAAAANSDPLSPVNGWSAADQAGSHHRL